MLEHVNRGRRWGTALAAVIVAVGILACGWVATSGAADANTNRAAAQSEASRLLSLIQLPPGTTSSQTEPAGDRGRLAQPGYDEATPNLVDAGAWWTTAMTPDAVLTYVRTHRPAGASPFSTTSDSGPNGVSAESFTLPPVAGVLRERVISVMVTRLAGGHTGVRTDGEAVWITPRPAWEQIPRTVRSITLTAQGSTASGRSGRASVPRTVAGDVVQRVVGFINGLDLVQPGAVACPGGRYELLRLTFRAADGSVLAAAVEQPTGCASVALSVGGRSGPALDDYPTVTSELVRLGVIRRCTGRQLRVAADPLARDAGGDVLTLTFTNRSDGVCRMTGFPGLRLIDRRGHRLRMTLRHVGSAASVALDPGEAAWALATSTRCNAPRARWVRVGPPGTPASVTLRVGSRGRPYAPCHGRINVSAFSPAF
jgi:hypothetical protein